MVAIRACAELLSGVVGVLVGISAMIYVSSHHYSNLCDVVGGRLRERDYLARYRIYIVPDQASKYRSFQGYKVMILVGIGS